MGNLIAALTVAGLVLSAAGETVGARAAATPAPPQSHAGKGVVQSLSPEQRTITIAHGAITGYMPAMTMCFKVKAPAELADIRPRDVVTFTLRVTGEESWVEQVTKTGTAPAQEPVPIPPPAGARRGHPLLYAPFTNELGQVVCLNDFKGQALAITFFFTRCPIPEYCPRLSRNFQEASAKLLALHDAPTNWHFLSISFDTDFDSPAVLNAYAERYPHDPAHWSFLTGAPAQIRELAAQSDAHFEREGAFFNHNFRTLVIDAAGHLQMSFPIGGDLSEALVEQMLKAAAATNKSG